MQLYREVPIQLPPSPYAALLTRFAPISLVQMNGVTLLNRTDTKYVMTTAQLYQALTSITSQYRVLDINGMRLNHYRTLYFDTPDFSLYLQHHAGKGDRCKVRSRKYVDTELSFLEVKHKVNKNRTIKNRVQTPGFITSLTPETDEFLQTYYPLNSHLLEPKLWNEFSRMTLVSKSHPERLTLDLNLRFYHDSRMVTLPGLAIAEVKQEDSDRNSDFIRQMRAMNIRPTGFSKYCIGVSMLYQAIKHNNFKPKLRLIHKLTKGNYYVQ